MIHRTSYIVHVHRTSHIVHRTSYIPHFTFHISHSTFGVLQSMPTTRGWCPLAPRSVTTSCRVRRPRSERPLLRLLPAGLRQLHHGHDQARRSNCSSTTASVTAFLLLARSKKPDPPPAAHLRQHAAAAPPGPRVRPRFAAPPPPDTSGRTARSHYVPTAAGDDVPSPRRCRAWAASARPPSREKLGRDLAGRFPGGVLRLHVGWAAQPDFAGRLALDLGLDLRTSRTSTAAGHPPGRARRPGPAAGGARCLWDVELGRSLSRWLPAEPALIVTSRDAALCRGLCSAVERLDALPEAEALALLANFLGPLDGYEPAGREVAALVEGLPLALELAATAPRIASSRSAGSAATRSGTVIVSVAITPPSGSPATTRRLPLRPRRSLPAARPAGPSSLGSATAAPCRKTSSVALTASVQAWQAVPIAATSRPATMNSSRAHRGAHCGLGGLMQAVLEVPPAPTPAPAPRPGPRRSCPSHRD